MTFSMADALGYRMRRAHEWARTITADLEDAVLDRRHSPASPPIGFHLWHIARSTDRNTALLKKNLGGPTDVEETWHQKGLAERWGMTPRRLGAGETGMEMSDEASESFVTPPRDELRDYIASVFDALETVLNGLSDDQLEIRLEDVYERQTTVGEMLLQHLSHVDRHVGMIESLRGVEGLRGSATI
jgi:hypothetical protein